MFSDDELNAFKAGKESGHSGKEYSNPHLDFVSGLGGEVGITEDRLHKQYKRGYEWGQAQKHEEDQQ